MKAGQRLWTREELILAINLYCKTPFGKIHRNNPAVIHLAELLGRSANSVSFKLVNFASFDPSLQKRGIKGAQNASKLDREIWDEFYNNWESKAFESEILLAKTEKVSLEKLNNIDETELPKAGKERERMVKTRVNQSFFRKSILASYNNTCCITGIPNPELLIASHIKPWSLDIENRLNLRNGIAINALHDKAFENGLITITPDLHIRVSSILKKSKKTAIDDYFIKYDGCKMHLPKRFLPDPVFLEYHNDVRFRK